MRMWIGAITLMALVGCGPLPEGQVYKAAPLTDEEGIVVEASKTHDFLDGDQYTVAIKTPTRKWVFSKSEARELYSQLSVGDKAVVSFRSEGLDDFFYVARPLK